MAFFTISTMIWALIACVAIFLVASVMKQVSGFLIKLGVVVFILLLALQLIR